MDVSDILRFFNLPHISQLVRFELLCNDTIDISLILRSLVPIQLTYSNIYFFRLVFCMHLTSSWISIPLLSGILILALVENLVLRF